MGKKRKHCAELNGIERKAARASTSPAPGVGRGEGFNKAWSVMTDERETRAFDYRRGPKSESTFAHPRPPHGHSPLASNAHAEAECRHCPPGRPLATRFASAIVKKCAGPTATVKRKRT